MAPRQDRKALEFIMTADRKAAFFDLDGTLACHSGPPCPADVEAIRAFRRLGHLAVLCTGRSAGFLYPAVLDIGFDGIISGAGARVVLQDTLLYRRTVSGTALRRVLPYFARTGQPCVLEGEQGMFIIGEVKGRRLPYEPLTDPFLPDGWAEEHPISKLTLYGQLSAEALAWLGDDFHVIQHPTYAEACPAGCSKSDGMRRLLEAAGIYRENSLAFGDSHNDLDMLRYAGIGVAMGIADDEVRAAADLVTDRQENAGVAQALYRLFPGLDSTDKGGATHAENRQ